MVCYWPTKNHHCLVVNTDRYRHDQYFFSWSISRHVYRLNSQ